MAEKNNDNEKSSIFKRELKDFFNTSFKFSKKGLKKAGEAISDFGDTSVIKIDIAKYNLKLEKNYLELGKLCAESFTKGKKASISKKDEDVVKILESIEKLRKSIEDAENKLNPKTDGGVKKASAAKKASVKKPAEKKSVEKKTSEKKTSVKKTAEKKAPAKKTAANKKSSSSSDKTIVMGS